MCKYPEEVTRVVNNGPKFSFQTTIPAHEILFLNRHISSRAKAEDQERYVLDGTDSLLRTVPKGSRNGRDPVDGVVRFLKKNDLRVPVSDKKGGFVLMKKGIIEVKVTDAIRTNFKEVRVSAPKVESEGCWPCVMSPD
ncbi:hypothetical protein MRX96_003577 [Rhipicephalus microplus]